MNLRYLIELDGLLGYDNRVWGSSVRISARKSRHHGNARPSLIRKTHTAVSLAVWLYS